MVELETLNMFGGIYIFLSFDDEPSPIRYSQFSHISGSIPSSIGRLHKLKWLSLGQNEFTGSIPSTFGNLKALNHLNLEQNYFTGKVRPIWDLTQLEFLNLRSNFFDGSIHSSIRFLNWVKQILEVPCRPALVA
uniref:Uncharacterized protein n=1 Tax=Trieres chinensis TaxID=1514140 RepID=A0A7S1ZGD1_TRICV|mmetsp:Transcript_25132/g.51228  ORF Transcript_25132/g.51228 Transcript_25132/m.51228 type:complete len:134 (+) Transcript_25132:532-933(+)